MLLFHQEVFDEVIVNANTWYSSSEFNGLIGAADDLIVFAVVTDVVGGTPALKVYVDTSGDNEHWYEPGTEKINATLSSDTVKSGSVRLGVDPLAAFGRLRITLTGSGQCRLKLSVTGRSG